MIGVIIRRNNIVRALCLMLCVAIGFALHKYAGNALRKYTGVSASVFIKSPLAYWRMHERSWDSFKTIQYTQDHDNMHFRRYTETALLPLVIDGKRLSDSYPVPKMGGAIV